MADYEKMTVAAIRALMKDRGIPTISLTRKAQFIARIREWDAAEPKSAASSAPAPAPASDTPAAKATAPPAESAPVATSREPADTVVPQPQSLSESAAETQQSVATAATSETLRADVSSQTQQASIPVEEPTTAPVQASESVKEHMPQPMQALEPAKQHTPPPTQDPAPVVESSIPEVPPANDIPVEDPPQTQESSLSRIPTAELEEDRRKRKRRSATPSVDPSEVAVKRARLSAEGIAVEGVSQTAQDTMDVDKPAVEYAAEPPKTTSKAEASLDDELESKATDTVIEDRKEPDNAPTTEAVEKVEPESPTRRRPTEVREGRFQSLLQAESTDHKLDETNDDPEAEDAPAAQPAMHPATAALYIKNFQRPLREDQLKERLVQLASPNGDASDAVELFYLDPVRTHALVLFASMSAAARVRSALHDRVWPAERNRKPLWVDYIPEDRVQAWIDQEKSGGVGARAGGKRWEVVYDTVDGGDVQTRLQEVGSAQQNAIQAPTGPRADARMPPRSPSPHARRPEPQYKAPVQPAAAQKTFQTLDSLFKSTTQAKPKLYFQPVSPDLANKRMKEITDLTKRDWTDQDRRPNDELRRFTFEDGDVLVDSGAHFMSKKQMAKEGITSTGTTEPRRMMGRGGGGPPPSRRDFDTYRRPREESYDRPWDGRRDQGGYRPR